MSMNYTEFCKYYNENSDKNLDEIDVIMKVLTYLFEERYDKKGKKIGNWHKESAEITELHERGADIILTGGKTNGEHFTIEAKGKSETTEIWLTALSQLITRMDTHRVIAEGKKNAGKPVVAYKYGLALYWKSARAALNRIPVEIAKILTLHIFSVNDNGKVKEFTPQDFKRSDYKEEDFL